MCAMTVEDVPVWMITAGIGHAVRTGLGLGWIHTACGIMTNAACTEDRPKRICRECRERLKVATLIKRKEN